MGRFAPRRRSRWRHAGARPAAAAPAEEKTEFDVDPQGSRRQEDRRRSRSVRQVTSLGLKEAKDLVEGAPKTREGRREQGRGGRTSRRSSRKSGPRSRSSKRLEVKNEQLQRSVASGSTSRRSSTSIPIPNLIEVQKRSVRALPADVHAPADREDAGLQAVFKSSSRSPTSGRPARSSSSSTRSATGSASAARSTGIENLRDDLLRAAADAHHRPGAESPRSPAPSAARSTRTPPVTCDELRRPGRP